MNRLHLPLVFALLSACPSDTTSAVDMARDDLLGSSDTGHEVGVADAAGAPDLSHMDLPSLDATRDAASTDMPGDVQDAADAPDGGAELPQDRFPARILDPAALTTSGFGTLQFEARDGNVLNAHTYRATQFDDDLGPVLFVMHGAARTAQSYLAAAAPLAERRNALAVAIEFDEVRYPGSEDFTLGVGVNGAPRGDVYDASEWRAVEDYSYSEVEHLFEAIRTALGGRQPGYRLFGHSAGAQFTHRLVTFVPDARVIRAVAANAGWYTLPSAGAPGDPNFAMPYGLRGTPVEQDDARIVQAPLAVLVGARDTLTAAQDPNVRGTAEANAQGLNRFERGQFAHAVAEERALDLGVPLGWRLGLVQQGSHDKDEMMPPADFYLFGPDGSPCTQTAAQDAAGLVFNELLADPPDDVNGDGTRDPADDEFVELVNTGSTPVCLTGWTLGDASNDERHAFPIGSEVAPNKAIVVFGGGVPTGRFGSSMIQWVTQAGSLSLTNAGDVLTLRDHLGTVAAQVSWGDCAGVACATDHIAGSLGLDASIQRQPELTGPWAPHPASHTAGTRLDGSDF